MVLTLATPTEIRTVIALRNMVREMIVPDHDGYQGHTKKTCGICQVMANANRMLADYE